MKPARVKIHLFTVIVKIFLWKNTFPPKKSSTQYLIILNYLPLPPQKNIIFFLGALLEHFTFTNPNACHKTWWALSQTFSYLTLCIAACHLVNTKKTGRLKNVLDAVVKHSLNKKVIFYCVFLATHITFKHFLLSASLSTFFFNSLWVPYHSRSWSWRIRVVRSKQRSCLQTVHPPCSATV